MGQGLGNWSECVRERGWRDTFKLFGLVAGTLSKLGTQEKVWGRRLIYF